MVRILYKTPVLKSIVWSIGDSLHDLIVAQQSPLFHHEVVSIQALDDEVEYIESLLPAGISKPPRGCARECWWFGSDAQFIVANILANPV